MRKTRLRLAPALLAPCCITPCHPLIPLLPPPTHTHTSLKGSGEASDPVLEEAVRRQLQVLLQDKARLTEENSR